VAVAAVDILVAVELEELAVQVAVAQAAQLLDKQVLLELQAVAVVGVALAGVIQSELAALAALASSSFHTQAQHNYLVVALLPNQAVTSFTHSHLLAHLALCHLYLQVTW
jgi:uncharacterized membrane protein (Fun14 family)